MLILTRVGETIRIGEEDVAVIPHRVTRRSLWTLASLLSTLIAPSAVIAQSAKASQFAVEEASITDIQNAIKSGQTTCRKVVEAYFVRAKAYNGACTALLTKDGAPVSQAFGMKRAGALVKYPTQTVAASTVFPNLEQYQGIPLELGRMITSVSDPTVQLQYGWRVGIPEAGQLNALETLNIRGERSTTCKGDFDRAPSDGPLPAGAPAVCEAFRIQPDALERAAELDKQYGRNPDLKKLPMYCAVFSQKDWYDAKDMRGTGGNDVNFAMDVPKVDSPDIAVLREKGAIIYAISSAANVVGAASTKGLHKPKEVTPATDLQYSLWSGQACNPYDTARVPRGTSNGSGVSVAANLATCSICEQSAASCQGPASRNGIALLLTTKGILQDGGTMYRYPGDRAGIHCKTIKDATLVLDAIKGFKAGDSATAIPKGIIPDKPYVQSLVPDSAMNGNGKPLKGMRIGVAREFMVKHTKNDVAISDLLDKEIKAVLRDKLGAELVETVDPLYPDDPSIPNMTYTFQDAMSEILPILVPGYFYRTKEDGTLTFAVPGWDVRTIDYDVALSLRKAPLSPGLNLRTITRGLTNPSSLLFANQYLAARGDARVKDWASWVANASFKTEAEKARALNVLGQQDGRPDPVERGDGWGGDGPHSISYLEMQSVLRMIVLKVMQMNDLDGFVNPEQTTTPYLLGGSLEPDANGRGSQSCCSALTALMGAPEAVVPAGFVTTTVDPKYVLSPDKKSYIATTGDIQTTLPHPLPIALMFWAGPGYDADVIKVASAYESATHHRTPPPAFGPVSENAVSTSR